MIPLNRYILREEKPVKVKTSSVKSTVPEFKRLDLAEAERIYMTDALVRNAINTSVHLFDCDYEIEASTSRIKNEVEVFLDSIDFPQLRRDIARDAFVYGDAWCELVYKNNELIGVVGLNPRTIDYQKTNMGAIKLDRYGNPVGYLQAVNAEQIMDSQIQRRLVTVGGVTGIPLRNDQVARFYFDKIGDGWYGLGLIEPIYSVTLGKNEAEMGLSHVIHKVGFPIIIMSVGDEEHEPSPDMINNGLNLIKDLNYKTELSIPYYMKVDTLKVTRIEKLKEFLDYFIEQQITGMGLPGAIATGRGEDVNRSTLVSQIKIFMKINDARRNLFAYQFNTQVLARLAKSRNWHTTPKIVPKPTDIESLLEGVQKDTKRDKTGEIG